MKTTITLLSLAALLCGCATQPPTQPTPIPAPVKATPPPPLPSAPAAATKAPLVKGPSGPRIQSLVVTSGTGITATVSRSITPPPAIKVGWDTSTDFTITGYNVYMGVASRAYTNVVNAGFNNSVTISNLAFGTTYFLAATSYTAAGLESDYSAEISWASPSLPLPPGNFQMKASFADSLPGPWQNETNWPAVFVTNPLGNTFWRLNLERVLP